MTNLFDVADAIRHNKALIHGLILINRSTVFPVLPVTLQQKTERLLIDHQMIQERDKVIYKELKSVLAVADIACAMAPDVVGDRRSLYLSADQEMYWYVP